MRTAPKVMAGLLAGCAVALVWATPNLPSKDMAVTAWTSWVLAAGVTAWAAYRVADRHE